MAYVFEEVQTNPIIAGDDWVPGDPLYQHPGKRWDEAFEAGGAVPSTQHTRMIISIHGDHDEYGTGDNEMPCRICREAGDELIVVE